MSRTPLEEERRPETSPQAVRQEGRSATWSSWTEAPKRPGPEGRRSDANHCACRAPAPRRTVPVEARRGEDKPIDSRKRTHRQRSHPDRDLTLETLVMCASGKNSSLRLLTRSRGRADDRDTLGRCVRTPHSPSDHGQEPRSASYDERYAGRCGGHPGDQFEDDREDRGPDERPRIRERGFVDGQMAERPLVAIVEPERLRHHDQTEADQRPGNVPAVPRPRQEARRRQGARQRHRQKPAADGRMRSARRGLPAVARTSRSFGGVGLGGR